MTPKERIIEMEDERARLAVIEGEYNAKREDVLAKVHDELDALAYEYGTVMEEARKRVADAESAVRESVLLAGETAKGRAVMAVYVKPSIRVTWDTGRLDGYAAAHPEILPFRSEKPVAARVDLKAIK